MSKQGQVGSRSRRPRIPYALGAVCAAALAVGFAGIWHLLLFADAVSPPPLSGSVELPSVTAPPTNPSVPGEIEVEREKPRPSPALPEPSRPAVGEPAPPLPHQPGPPDFPWPPPTPSALQPLPSPLGQLGFLTLGQVADWLTQTLDQRSYFDRSYHAVPNGFALVTRLERIKDDGTPFAGTDRWPTDLTVEGFSLARYLQALFAAPEGRYRVLVFVVTPELVTPSGERPTERYMLGLLSGGADRLPASVRDAPLTPDHTCVALIYEFERRGLQGQPALLVPGHLTGRDHLVAAGLW